MENGIYYLIYYLCVYKYVYIYVIHTLLKSASSVIKRMNNQKHIISRLMNAKQNKRVSEKKKKKGWCYYY